MKKKTTDRARQFWALAEQTAEQVEAWPEWERRFADGVTPAGTTPETSSDADKPSSGPA